ncbi:MAG: isoprenylcysteine carboxylmethyltransferase family protein [Candidatus Aminicenantales bacterium]
MSSQKPKEKSVLLRLLFSSFLKLILGIAVMGALIFFPAGTLRWGKAWTLLLVFLGCLFVNLSVLMRKNPDLIRERIKLRQKSKRWDIVITSIIGVFALSLFPLAGLDYRFGWSPRVTVSLVIAALVILVLGDLIFLWSMTVNKFFSKHVHIQKEKGHSVVTEGPYQFVRHPGYVGWILMVGPIPVALGSLWALIPGGLSVLILVIRTALEDKTLQKELEGYAEYARRVRYRLLPGIW